MTGQLELELQGGSKASERGARVFDRGRRPGVR